MGKPDLPYKWKGSEPMKSWEDVWRVAAVAGIFVAALMLLNITFCPTPKQEANITIRQVGWIINGVKGRTLIATKTKEEEEEAGVQVMCRSDGWTHAWFDKAKVNDSVECAWTVEAVKVPK